MSQFGADHAALAGDGADINSANDRGAHPLMLAAHDANVECVSLLLKSGADAHLSLIHISEPTRPY